MVCCTGVLRCRRYGTLGLIREVDASVTDTRQGGRELLCTVTVRVKADTAPGTAAKITVKARNYLALAFCSIVTPAHNLPSSCAQS